MTPREFKTTLKGLGLKQVDFIRVVAHLDRGTPSPLSPVTVYRWTSGKTQIPALAAACLELLRRLPDPDRAALVDAARAQ